MSLAAPPRPPERRLWARVTGRVQGVGFRATTVAVARRLDLAGWVRNLIQGDVELEAEGKPEALEELVVFLHHGPRGARVDNVQVDWVDQPQTSSATSSGGLLRAPLPRPFETRRTA